jgi:hypothetical protein
VEKPAILAFTVQANPHPRRAIELRFQEFLGNGRRNRPGRFSGFGLLDRQDDENKETYSLVVARRRDSLRA